MRKLLRWCVADFDIQAVKRLTQELAIHPLVAHLLIVRGLTDPQKIYTHLYPSLKDFADPFLLPDMEKAVDRVIKAIHRKEKVAIYGDYDVDGITGAAVIYNFLKELGLLPLVFFPNRERDGYGFHPQFVPIIKSQGAKLIITVDCGINGHEACKIANELGIDVIVTDHHELHGDLPGALAVINPKRLESRYPERNLAGVGVAFALIRALRQTLYKQGFFEGRGIPNLRQYLDLVALGTIADIVPLTGENRLISYFGLIELNHTKRIGLVALKAVSGIEDQNIGITEVIYRLAPRINAAGRLKEAEISFRLLTTEDEQEANTLAYELNRLNSERQRIEDRILNEALEQIEKSFYKNRFSLVLAGKNWPIGVIGIVASRLQELFYRPVVLLSLEGEFARGSGRSIPEVNIFQCLCKCQEHLLRFGGHPAAAGLKIDSSKLDDFIDAFEKAVEKMLAGKPAIPTLFLDAWIKVTDILDPKFLEGYLRLGPFGPGYPEPIFALKDFEVRQPRVVKDKHFKFFVCQQGRGLEAIGFGIAENIPEKIAALAASIDFSEFQGRHYVQLVIRDWKTSYKELTQEFVRI